MKDINYITKEIDNTLEKHGLETYPGCGSSLMESVRTEFGDKFADEAMRYIPTDVVKEAVYHTLFLFGIE